MMKRPDYINHYLFDWDLLDVVFGGKSAFDSKSFVATLTSTEQVNDFLRAYGFDQSDLVLKAENFRYFSRIVTVYSALFFKRQQRGGH